MEKRLTGDHHKQKLISVKEVIKRTNDFFTNIFWIRNSKKYPSKKILIEKKFRNCRANPKKNYKFKYEPDDFPAPKTYHGDVLVFVSGEELDDKTVIANGALCRKNGRGLASVGRMIINLHNFPNKEFNEIELAATTNTFIHEILHILAFNPKFSKKIKIKNINQKNYPHLY